MKVYEHIIALVVALPMLFHLFTNLDPCALYTYAFLVEDGVKSGAKSPVSDHVATNIGRKVLRFAEVQ